MYRVRGSREAKTLERLNCRDRYGRKRIKCTVTVIPNLAR